MVIGIWLNVAAFQALWFASVLGAANGLPWLGPVVLTMWLSVHLNRARGGEWRLISAAALVGLIGDSALVLAGQIAFPDVARLGAPTTIWMVALWAGFAATLRWSLRWMLGRYALGAALGAIAGPLSYFAGSTFGALDLLAGTQSLVFIGLEWAVAMPLLLRLAESCRSEARLRMDGVPR